MAVPVAAASPMKTGEDPSKQQQQQGGDANNAKLDTAETRQYTQKHRLWTLGELLSFNLMTKKPKDPIGEIVSTLEKEKEKRTEQVDAPSPEVVQEAKQYIQELRIAFLFEDWYKSMIESRAEDPLEFSIQFFKKIQDGQQQQQQQQKN